MRYEILAEGGFIGIPKKYEGELDLSEKDLSALLESMSLINPINVNLRDGIIYNITLYDNEKSIEAQFDEDTLPQKIRAILKH